MRLSFLLTKDEIVRIFNDYDLRYVNTAYTKSPNAEIYNSIMNIPKLGMSKTGDRNTDNRYLLVLPTISVIGRRIIKNDQTVVWAWDNINIEAPVICFGGLFDGRYLTGEMNLIRHSSAIAKKLFGSIKRRMLKNTRMVFGVHVSIEVYNQRLPITLSIKINPELDFKYDC